MLSIFLVGALLSSAFALSSSSGTGGSQGSVSSHVELQLDDSSLYSEYSTSASGILNKVSQMHGAGENSIVESISGDSYTVSNAVAGSGAMSTSSSVQASAKSGSANQKASVTGEFGFIGSSSSSSLNTMMVAGGFEGEGYLSTDITARAGTTAATTGSANILGVNCLDGENSQYLASNEMAMTVDGLHLTSNGDLGEFGFAALNVMTGGKAEGRKGSDGTIVPGTYSYYNDPNAWVTGGWKWKDNPNIQLYLRKDSNLQSESLNANLVSSAILGAANTWDGATNQNLFANSVIQSTSVKADKLDGKNVHAWLYDRSGALGYSRTYYYPSVYVTGADGKKYWKAAESDVCYNTAYRWTTDASKAYLDPNPNAPLSNSILDVQTVALHELGHTIGLGDTYLHNVYKYDLSQIMGFYDGVQRNLGAGDINGVKALYG